MSLAGEKPAADGDGAKRTFLVCYMSNAAACSNGIWAGDEPLQFSIPLLLAQVTVIFTVSSLTHALLRHLGQPRFISHVVAGILLGPSFWSHETAFMSKLFPVQGWVHVDILSNLACMLYVFIIGVKTNVSVVRSSGRRGVAIAEAGTIVPFVATMVACTSIRPVDMVDLRTGTLYLQIIARWSVTSNNVLACVLDDLNLLTSKLGRLAMSASLIADLQYLLISMVCVSFAVGAFLRSPTMGVSSFMAFVAFMGVIGFCMRPAALWIARRTPEGGTLDESHFLMLVMMAITCGLAGELLGHSSIVGPLMLGLVLPGGPPLGTTLSDRMDRFMSGVFLPIYMVSVGLRTNLFALWDPTDMPFYMVMLGVCSAAKFATVYAVCSLYCRLRARDSAIVGLMMSCRGILELHSINTLFDDQIIDDHFYAVCVLWILGLGGISAALVKLLYKPSIRFATGKRRTMQHAPRVTELRILACVHCPENVRPLLALLSPPLSAPSGGPNHRRSQLGFFILHLVPLIGRTSGVLAPYGDKKRRHNSSATDAIVNAFRAFEWALPHVTFFPFVGASPYVSMHEDVCGLAADKRTVIVVLPFHKHLSSSGIECSNPSIQSMNVQVLRYAPCSVAILVGRRWTGGSGSTAERAVTRSTTVLFLGGADDREALAVGSRLAENPTVHLTVMRVMPPAETWKGSAEETEDEEAVEEFREKADGTRLVYRQVVASDGSDTVDALKEICEECTFLILGRREGMESVVTVGLEEWREYPELGVIGDMMAVAEFGSKVSTLVVQQQVDRGEGSGEDGDDDNGSGASRSPAGGSARVHHISGYG